MIKSRIKSEGIGPESLAVGRYSAGKHPNKFYGGSTNSNLGEFNQRTGIMRIDVKGLNFAYENDGTPFQWLLLGDGNDSYRTAGLSLGYKDFTVQSRLFTGSRTKESMRADRFKMPAPSYDSKTGVNYPNGLVTEVGTPYRYGELSLNSSWGNIGINSEYVRHKIQNEFAHGIGQPQPYFKVLDWNSHLVLNGSYTNLGFNTHSLWH